MASHTKEQETIVLKILSYKPHQYYEILSVLKTAEETEIKKSYRRLAVKLHPDKNPHPRSAEAFKFVNKAWEVLSDPAKKRIFDQTGSDPDSRFSGVSEESFGARGASPFTGFLRGGGGIDEEILNMFFGGGMPNQTFTFGGNGFTFQSYGGSPFGGSPFGGSPFGGSPFGFAQQQPRRRTARAAGGAGGANRTNGEDVPVWDTLKQLLPILMFLLVPLISNLFAGERVPQHSFTRTEKFNIERKTPNHKIPFYVQNSYVEDRSKREVRRFDSKVEEEYVLDLKTKCMRERNVKSDMIEDAHGWFSVDEAKLAKAESLQLPNCAKLQKLNLL